MSNDGNFAQAFQHQQQHNTRLHYISIIGSHDKQHREHIATHLFLGGRLSMMFHPMSFDICINSILWNAEYIV